MPNYLARVVLHRLNSKGNDSYEDYKDFHAEMAKLGFKPVINGFSFSDNTKISRALPGGLYYFDSALAINKDRTYTLKEAFDAVNAAVTEVVQDESKYIQDANEPHSVLVTEAGQSMWSGLKPPPMRGIQVRKAIFP